MKVSVLNDLDNRRLCVLEGMERLQARVSVKESDEKKIHVVSMVRAFGCVPSGWQCLTEAVQYLADYDLPSRHAASLAHSVALPVSDHAAELELRALLGGLDRITAPALADLYGAAAGAHFGPLPGGCHTAWDAYQLLTHTNRPTDGTPRSARFLQELAATLPPERGEPIRTWAGRQTWGGGEDPATARRRAGPPHADTGPQAANGTHSAYLMIRLSPSVSSPDRVDITCWTNTGKAWEPRRRDDTSVPRAQVRRHVAALVDREEARLHTHRGGIVLEFILPLSLLNEPVEEWSRIGALGDRRLWASEHGGPPFWQDYTVVVRSLERIETLQLHRVWNERWDVLTARAGEARAHRCGGPDTAENHQLYLRLKRNPGVVLMALGAPPDQLQGKEELLMGLHAGLPVLVWSHSGPLAERVHYAVETALQYPLSELLKHMVRLRTTLPMKDDEFPEGDTGAGIAVLWDDPSRLPEFPEPIFSPTTDTLVKPDVER